LLKKGGIVTVLLANDVAVARLQTLTLMIHFLVLGVLSLYTAITALVTSHSRSVLSKCLTGFLLKTTKVFSKDKINLLAYTKLQ
jgi:hypothetical protein